MNLTIAKSTLWLGSLLVFGWLGFKLYDYKRNESALLSTSVTPERQKIVIEEGVKKPKSETASLVDYDRVVANFHSLNWTGKKPPPVVKPVDPGPAKAVRDFKSVDKLLAVLYIQVDSRKPEHSLALAVPLEPKLSPKGEKQLKLVAGELLPAPFAYWKVAAIESEGVRFVYVPQDDEDTEREPEMAYPPTPLEGGIVEVGEDGEVLVPTAAASIPEAISGAYTAARPDRTIEISPGRYRMGAEDLDEFGENYLDILSNEVRTKNHLNQKTGKWEGIEITSVAPGSLAAQHGAKSGDVVISINGHPVNSVNEAISFAKNNKDVYTVWNVVVSNAGAERTLVFETD